MIGWTTPPRGVWSTVRHSPAADALPDPIMAGSSSQQEAANVTAFAPWSMRVPDEKARVQFSSIYWPQQQPEDISCIVCYDNIGETSQTQWHHCRVCSGMWCDACMENMFNTVRDSEDHNAELSCPQCRTSVGEMQMLSRVARYTEHLACTEDEARFLVLFENLFTEMVHLAECAPDGQPYFMLAPSAVARIMSRDQFCDVITESQDHAAGTRLRRMLRAERYGDCAAMALEGYAAALRAIASVPSALPYLELIASDLRQLSASAPTFAASDVLPSVERVVAAERAREAQQPKRQQQPKQPKQREQQHLGPANGSTQRGQGASSSSSVAAPAASSSAGRRRTRTDAATISEAGQAEAEAGSEAGAHAPRGSSRARKAARGSRV